MKTTVAAVDFGTSKIVTLVADNSSNLRCDIVGAGIAAYDGFMDAGWNNPGDVNDRIRESIEDAERQSKRKLRDINIGVPAFFTRAYSAEVTVELKGTDPRVSTNDVKQAFRAAEQKIGNVNGIKVHSTPAWFSIDNGKKTLEPVGKAGRELRAMISFVYADRFFVEDVTLRLSDLGYNASNIYATAPGEMMLFLPEEERDHTAVLIDVGYLTTDVMIAEGDALVYLETIDIGGGNIAADLAYGLDIKLEQAEERVKRPYIFGVENADETYDIPPLEGRPARSFTRKEVSRIIEARVDEIAEEIQAAIKRSGVKLGNWSNYYMTGGGLCFNRGGYKYLGQKLGVTVKETPKRTAKLNSHSYSSALGLMDLIIDTIEIKNRQPVGGGKVREFFRNLLGG
ncbi:MAG: hypothetical protein IKS31_12265 [Clostridia bacterium]|nr:hypothetical protein [Clostridia bacterium]MBR4459724.1 hypothetical protein [Clostridia bacterium]